MIEFEQLKEKVKPFIQKNYLPLGLGFLGLIFLVYGLIVLLAGAKSSSDVPVFESASQSLTSAKMAQALAVDVEGAVVKPGVYHVLADARVKDALISAGGLSSQADRAWIEKNVNLAAKLSDGVKIYIPKLGDQVSASQNTTAPSVYSSSTTSTTGLININTASEGELDSLPGIGPVIASKIINGRPYSSINDLLDKKVVTSKVFEKIKDKINTY